MADIELYNLGEDGREEEDRQEEDTSFTENTDNANADSSKELIDNISDAKYGEKGKLIVLKFKGEDVKLTSKGGINRSAMVQNKGILKEIESTKEEYDKSLTSVIDESAGTSMSDEAQSSVQENVADNLQDLVWDRYNEISQNDLDKNIEREINRILHVDDNVDYDNLIDRQSQSEYSTLERFGRKGQDPSKTLLYKTAKELCIAKKSHMEVKAGFHPESEKALSMTQEETERNDLTRFERLKKWAKENMAGVLAVAILGIIMTVVMAGRKAIKKGAKAVGEFGKALANLAKKAAPAIATILNILAQVFTWGARALEFLSRNLWIMALAITYFLYNEVKERGRRR